MQVASGAEAQSRAVQAVGNAGGRLGPCLFFTKLWGKGWSLRCGVRGSHLRGSSVDDFVRMGSCRKLSGRVCHELLRPCPIFLEYAIDLFARG